MNFRRLASLILAPLLLAGDADLVVTMDVAPDPVVLAENVGYTLNIENRGPDPATDVEVIFTLPPGATFVIADSGGVYGAKTHNVTWNLGTINVGQPVILTVDLTVKLPDTGSDIEVFFGGGAFADAKPSLFQLTPQAQLLNPILSEGISHIPHGLDVATDDHLIFANPGSPDLTDGGGAPLRDGIIAKLEKGPPTPISSGGLLVNPRSLVMDPQDRILVADPFGLRDDGEGGITADTTGRIIAIDPGTGEQEILAEGNHLVEPRGLAISPSGQLFVVDGSRKLIEVNLSTGAQTLHYEDGDYTSPQAITISPEGDIFVADSSGIFSVDPSTFQPSILTNAGKSNTLVEPFDLQIGFNNQLFVSDSGYESGVGAIHDIDSSIGSILATFPGSDGGGAFRNPTGIHLQHMFIASAYITSPDTDPQPADNFFSYASKVTPGDHGPEPAVINVVENIGVLDTILAVLAPQISITEGVTVTDLNVAALAPQVLVTEGITVTDPTNAALAPQIMLNEAITVADANSAAPASQINIGEIISGSMALNTQVESGPGGIKDLRFYQHLKFIDESPSRASMTQLHVIFTELMKDSDGNTDSDDVTNPIHYKLIQPGEDGKFDTETCEVSPQDVLVVINEVNYDPETSAAVLRFGNGLALPRDKYRLIICGDTGLTDLEGQGFDGDGDETAGGDYLAEFELGIENQLINPNFDDGLEGWTLKYQDPPSADFVPRDASYSPTSGSAGMFDIGEGIGGTISQCVQILPNNWYRFGGGVHQERETPDPVLLTLQVEFFDSSDCNTEPAATETVKLQLGPRSHEWVQWDKTIKPPEGMSGARITIGYPEGTIGTGQLFFDDLLFARDPDLIFADGFESGDVSRWK